eukprot:7089-Eustigmatos_ZCMA.PRE.1
MKLCATSVTNKVRTYARSGLHLRAVLPPEVRGVYGHVCVHPAEVFQTGEPGGADPADSQPVWSHEPFDRHVCSVQ